MTESKLGAGDLDPGFGPMKDGKLVLTYPEFTITHGQTVSQAPDGKIYIAGSSWDPDTDRADHFTLTRVLNNGDLDPDFGTAGTVHVKLPLPGCAGLGTTPFQILYLGENADEKLIVCVGEHVLGVGASTETNYLVRLTHKGELDKSFGTDGILILKQPSKTESNQLLLADVMQHASGSSSRGVQVADGKIYVISSSTEPGVAGLIARVMRFDFDGVPDLSFNKTGYASLSEVFNARSSFNDIVVRDGKITVCGWAGSGALLARLNIDGTFDKNFAGAGYRLLEGPDFQFAALAVLDDGRTVAAGYGFSPRKGLLAAYTSDGKIDRGFHQGAPIYENFDNSGSVMFLGMGAMDGKIIASGRYVRTGQNHTFVTARYLGDGELDRTFGDDKGWTVPDLSGYSPLAHGMSLQSDGKILVVGNDQRSYYSYASIVVRLLNAG